MLIVNVCGHPQSIVCWPWFFNNVNHFEKFVETSQEWSLGDCQKS